MTKEEIQMIRDEQIRMVINMPISKDEKMDKIATIINKTDEEIIEESKEKTTFLSDMRLIYKGLFEKEGNKDENKKHK